MKGCYRHRGTISVFLTLILLPTIVFGGLVTDAVRIYHSEGLVSEAGELAMNAGLSYYDMQLKDDYGLFVMQNNPDSMKSTLEEYFVNSIRASGLDGSEDITSMLDLKKKGFDVYNVDGSQIYQTEVEKQQILEYMKYRAPVCLGEELLEKLNQIKDSKKQTDAIHAQIEYGESMDDLQDCCEKTYKKLEEYLSWVKIGEYVIKPAKINLSIAAAEEGFKQAVEYHFLMDTIDSYDEKGSIGTEGDVLSFMSDFNTQAANFSTCSESNAKDAVYVNSCMQCLFDQKSVKSLGGPPSPLLLDDDEMAIRAAYLSNQSVLIAYRQILNGQFQLRIQEAWQEILAWYGQISTAKDAAQDAMEQLQKLKKEIENVRKKHETWEGRVNALSDGEMKKSMSKSLEKDSYESLLNEAEVAAFEQKLKDNIETLDRMLARLEAMTFCGVEIVSVSSGAAVSYVEPAITDYKFYPNSEAAVTSEAKSKAADFVSAGFKKETIPADWNLYSIENEKIYKDLKKISTETGDKDASKENKKKTDDLIKSTSSEKETSDKDGLDAELVKDVDYKQDKPSEVLSQNTSDKSKDNDLPGGGTGKKERKDAMNNAKTTLSSTSDTLGDLSKLLEAGIEKIFIMEYGMQMFSYYTVNKDKDGKKIEDVRSISDRDLTTDAMYKSEVEYMLWGNESPEENIRNTKLMLYGIRILFNLIYAFSDQKVSAAVLPMATAMSCGVAFLVPVFEVLLKVTLAGAETVCDVSDLMQGKSVPLIKKSENAYISLTSFAKKAAGSRGGGFTMNYKEYLTVFLLLHTFGREGKTLARIADCIQLNTKQDIVNTPYTMLSVNAEVECRTSFMSKAAKLPDGGSGASVNDWYTITYKSVLGY